MMFPPIVSVEDVDAYLSGDKAGRIDQATDAIRAYCGWHVTPEVTETVTLWGEGSQVLSLRSLRVVDVTSVTVDGREVTGWSWRTEGLLMGRTWPKGARVEVTMTHGYESLPAVVGVVAEMVMGRMDNPTGQVVSAVSLGSARVSYGASSGGGDGRSVASASQMAVLDLYKLPALP